MLAVGPLGHNSAESYSKYTVISFFYECDLCNFIAVSLNFFEGSQRRNISQNHKQMFFFNVLCLYNGN